MARFISVEAGRGSGVDAITSRVKLTPIPGIRSCFNINHGKKNNPSVVKIEFEWYKVTIFLCFLYEFNIGKKINATSYRSCFVFYLQHREFVTK